MIATLIINAIWMSILSIIKSMFIHRIKGIFLLKLAKISCDFFSHRICNCYKANDRTNHFWIVINNRSAGKKTKWKLSDSSEGFGCHYNAHCSESPSNTDCLGLTSSRIICIEVLKLTCNVRVIAAVRMAVSLTFCKDPLELSAK